MLPSLEPVQAKEHAGTGAPISHKQHLSWHRCSAPPCHSSGRGGAGRIEHAQYPLGKVSGGGADVGLGRFQGISGFSEKLLLFALSWRIMSH